MSQVIRHSYNFVRTIVVGTLVTVLLAIVGTYVALLVPAVQERIKTEGEKQLSELLGTEVTIGKIHYEPFNRLALRDVHIPDQSGGELIDVDKIEAGINLRKLLFDRRIVIDYGGINGLHGHISRPDKNSPTNLQFIIDAFKPKPDQPSKPFDVALQHIVIRNCDITYDVLNEPKRQGQFDANHISISDLRADISPSRLKKDDFDFDIKRLSFNEQSGFTLKNLTTHLAFTQQEMHLTDLSIELPNSVIQPDDIHLKYNSLKTIGNDIKQSPQSLALHNSRITPADLKAFAPQLAQFTNPIDVDLAVNGTLSMINVPRLSLLSTDEGIALDLNGTFTNLNDPKNLQFNLPMFKVNASNVAIAKITSNLAKMPASTRDIITRLGDVAAQGNAHGNTADIHFDGNVRTSLGEVTAKADVNGLNTAAKHFAGHVKTPDFLIGKLIAKEKLLGAVAFDSDVDISLKGNNVSGKLKGNINHIDLNGYRYTNILADVEAHENEIKGRIDCNDPNANLTIDGIAQLAGDESTFDFNLNARNINPEVLRLSQDLAGKRFTGNMTVSLTGNRFDNATGQVALSDFTMTGKDDKQFNLKNLIITADNANQPQIINIDSDYGHGSISGQYNFESLVPSLKSILSKAFPKTFASFAQIHENQSNKFNDFTFSFTIDPSDEINELLKLPVKLIYKASIDGNFNERDKLIDVNVRMPYLQQGKNLIEGTEFYAGMNESNRSLEINANTLVPSKNGKIALTVNAVGANDQIDTDFAWKVRRDRDFHGNFNMSAKIFRDDRQRIAADVNFNPTTLVFNDTAWSVEGGNLRYANDIIKVNNLYGSRDKQFVRIDGTVSKGPDDVLNLTLNDINLDYIFETLNIDHVQFGGQATGEFFLSDLLSKSPRLRTPDLHVDNLTYNKALMGDIDIESHWVHDTKSVVMNGNLAQKNGEHSIIKGEIFTTMDSLYIDFNAHKANVEFMKPFMQAFTSDVKGEVSGHAVLFGNFHTIDLYGDIFVDNLSFKLDYTNTIYTCSDSVHMTPGNITFNNVTIRDRDKHDAKLSGWLKHDAFHKPEFNFSITEAKDFLCYDISPAQSPDWYGTIYGNGSAFVSGEPGLVKIAVNMQTAPRSKFTFVLSDTEEASQYNFITYRDRDKKDLPAPADTLADISEQLPFDVRQFIKQNKVEEQAQPTIYSIDLQGDITNDAQMILVMDPVGGDKIKATGDGHLRLTYDNADDRFEMFGKYTLDHGSYNFTLQDIIIKDFTIKEGSSISFNGDPYKAVLDLEAIYSLNANIRDLDESFADDREIKRTNVPVHALLKAKGEISQPEISFDLEFPTLTADAYRKIKSIISTEEMMNRQIIYLLALNRFYTPDYMDNSTNSNEFSSVASSTISSQLSNMLGQLSDKWSISPNFRTDKGDFSDMEVDLALSSQLLNNRLLFNGNFGYRDNTFNTRNSNFIGDFDIEYLLNEKGTLRLKAYNHFNDQNYYVRNAMTTQGVGIVFKHDFDNLFRRKPWTPKLSFDTIRQPVIIKPANTDSVKQ